jgi:two-component system NtrC family sensor kinase
VNSILDDELLLRQAAVDIHRTFGFHNVMILMLDPAESRLELRAQASRRPRTSNALDHLSLDQGIVGRVVRTGKTAVVDDVQADRDFIDWFGDTRSEIAVPIQIESRVEGVLNVESDQVAAFGPMDRLVLETVAVQLAIALHNARLFGMVKEKEGRYRTLVESSPGAVLHLDLEGRIIYVNPAASDITGHHKNDLLHHVGGLVGLTVPEDQERLRRAVAAAISGLRTRELEFHVAHVSGGTRWVRASIQPLIGEDGEPTGLVVLARDQTEERELQDRLRQSEKLSSIGTLVSGVAHELNNPLAGILGFAQLLLQKSSEEWTRTDIEKIEHNARRCQKIVENLLHFARQSRMTKREAHIHEVIESVLRLNEYQFKMDNVEIRRDFAPGIPALTLDVNSWQQVFINLANNAREAMVGAKSEQRVITFRTSRDGEEVEVVVSDTGPGVRKELRSRVFDPFFTTKESGTGLGLGICWGIVRDHGGTIEVDEAEGGGAAFHIRLPLRRAEAAAEPYMPTIAPPRSSEGKGRRVLVVDDDTSVCDVVAQTLQNLAYQVDVVPSGEEALERIRSTPFDVVLSDLRMPGALDGFALFDQVREVMPSLAERVVFLTGNVLDPGTLERIQARGCRWVEKPFDIHHLARVVREVVAPETRAVKSGSV